MHGGKLLLCTALLGATLPTTVRSNPSQKQHHTRTTPQGSAQFRLRHDTASTRFGLNPSSQVLVSSSSAAAASAAPKPPLPAEAVREAEQHQQPVLHERFDSVRKEYSLSGDGGPIDAFLRDVGLIHETLNTTLTTPDHRLTKYPCDSSYSRIWTNRDWDKRKSSAVLWCWDGSCLDAMCIHTLRYLHAKIYIIVRACCSYLIANRHAQHAIYADCQGPLKRYSRHALSWPVSTTAKQVMPIVLVWGLYATTLCVLSKCIPGMIPLLKKICLNDGGLMGSFSASPIALLLTLRVNRALDRLLDAKKNWGFMKRSIRSLAGLLCTYVGPNNGEVALLACRYLVLLPWSLKGFLREQDDEAIIRTMLPPDEADWLLSSPAEHPLAILGRLRSLIVAAGEGTESSPMLCDTAQLQMAERLYDLETVVGTSKRLLGSPIAPTFTRHTSRLLCLFLCLLPPSLLGSGVMPLTVVMTTLLTSYILVGIDEIGLKIERPFPFIPMHHICTMSQGNVKNQVIMSRDIRGMQSRGGK